MQKITMAAIEELLHKTVGLDASSIGSSSIVRAVAAHQLACGIANQDQYLALLRNDPHELQTLVESLVVNETWFFREKEAFSALACIAQERARQAKGTQRLRILSLPCSTGEEPYSMVMTLLDAGLPCGQFQVDAVDISSHALRLARQACFSDNSFRGVDVGIRERYFTPSNANYQLAEAVKGAVQFSQGNLFAPDFLPGNGLYDVIFLRNVLIYFDDAMKTRAVAVVERLLADDGYLFTGSAEGGLLTSRQFVATKTASGYAFQKSKFITSARHAAAGTAPSALPPRHKPQRSAPIFKAPRVPPSQPPAVPTRNQAESKATLEDVSLLADQGKLELAGKLCAQFLERNGPSAQALYLMGLIRDAAGNALAAVSNYRKALYLDSSHAEALVHLSSLLDRMGDSSGASLLRSRFQRMRDKRAKK